MPCHPGSPRCWGARCLPTAGCKFFSSRFFRPSERAWVAIRLSPPLGNKTLRRKLAHGVNYTSVQKSESVGKQRRVPRGKKKAAPISPFPGRSRFPQERRLGRRDQESGGMKMTLELTQENFQSEVLEVDVQTHVE